MNKYKKGDVFMFELGDEETTKVGINRTFRCYGIKGTKAGSNHPIMISESVLDQLLRPKFMFKLERCPFCGSDPIMKKRARWTDGCEEAVTGYSVVCNNRSCVIYDADTTYFLTEHEAAHAWNTRKLKSGDGERE